MSRAWAAVRFDDGTIKFTIFHGTVDLLYTGLFDSFSWDLSGEWKPCVCGKDEPCEIASNYGVEHWRGRACRSCMALTEGSLEPPFRAPRGLPDWAEKAIGP